MVTVAWAPDYATEREALAYLRIGDDVDTAQVAVAVTASSRAIDKAAARQFGQLAVPTEWTYTPQYDRVIGRWVVAIDDVATTAGMVVKIGGVVVTDYVLWPRQAVAKGKVYTLLALGTSVRCSGSLDEALITALWGWPAIPAAVKQACLLQTSRFMARRDSPYGIAGSPADGSELRLLAAVDPDVRVALGPYVRNWAVA